MADKAEGKGAEASGTAGSAELTVVDAIKAIASYNARADLNNEHQMELFLRSWWSSTYNRPLKDPLLLSYTLEELLYEFYDKLERQKAAQEKVTKEADKIEEDKDKAVLDWAEAEEKRELEEMEQHASKAFNDPLKDPENVKWMREQIAKAKEVHGQEFGEDVELSFDE
jgi:hypothetical protein